MKPHTTIQCPFCSRLPDTVVQGFHSPEVKWRCWMDSLGSFISSNSAKLYVKWSIFQRWSKEDLEAEIWFIFRNTLQILLNFLHEIRLLKRLVLNMYKFRLIYIWCILICISILLFFFVLGRMSGMEERASRFRRPAYIPDVVEPIHAAQRGERYMQLFKFIS